MAASPRLQALLREQEEVLAAVRGRDELAPARLRDAVAAGPARSHRRRAFALAGAAAVAATTTLLVIVGSEPAPPTLAATTAFGARAAMSSRPVSRPGARTLPGVAVDGVRYPDWRHEYGWRARGSRVDRLGSRRATTVFYEKRGQRVAYTIVSGGPMSIPASSRPARWEGRLRHVFRANGRIAVTWERRGHTCLVSAGGVRGRTLVKLSA